MGQKWKNPPVMYVVAQVRFNQVLVMESYVSAIQEKLRQMDFPDYQKERVNSFTIPLGHPESTAPVVQVVDRHVFGNIDKNASFTLDNNALSFQMTEYYNFEKFLSLFLNVLAIVHESVKLSFTERVGIRYLDAVIPKESEALSDYLVPEALGMRFKANITPTHSYTEVLCEKLSDTIIARTIIQSNKIDFPMELSSARAYCNVNKKFTTFNGWHAVVDTDGYNEGRTAFDIDSIGKKLTDLHDEISISFKAMATPHALKVWEYGNQ